MQGLKLAYEEKIPQAYARYCCGHIYSNFQIQFPGLLLRNYFWEAAKSFDVIRHIEAMARIKAINVEDWKYLNKIPLSAWARLAFRAEIRCDQVTNNFTKSFSAWVWGA
ncbi:hypothetical protein ACH5RR_014674 [Cinchona calisaya]|uniref:Transposase n=1 Tax=Cinchona calisaya TaxID=153742 RepID=A0ABD2ZQX8_9GENT